MFDIQPLTFQQGDEILVACERLPALVSYKIGTPSESAEIVRLKGNVLDLAFINLPGGGLIAVVSIDNVHEAAIKSDVGKEGVGLRRNHVSNTANNTSQFNPRLQYLSQQSGRWEEDERLAKALEGFSRSVGDDGSDAATNRGKESYKALQDVLYGVEKLRKRPGAED